MYKPNLKNCSTEELFEELESREGVQKFYAGPYQLYDIFPKYGAPLLAESSARLKAVAMRLDETSDTADRDYLAAFEEGAN